MIDNYQFGEIIIGGKGFDYDIEVRWDGEVLKWWRREGHIIDIEDVKRAVGQNPEEIIIGVGDSGMARVTEDARNFIKEKNISLVVDKTGRAVEVFNEGVEKRKRIIGLFHLTC